MASARERAELVNRLMLEVVSTSLRVQVEAERLTGSHELSPGKLGILRTLSDAGPSTVPEIARALSVARQGVQRNADALASSGQVEYVENPRHRRSRLLRATARGERRYRRARDARLAWAAWIDDGALSERDLRGALRALRWCRAVLSAVEMRPEGSRARARR